MGEHRALQEDAAELVELRATLAGLLTEDEHRAMGLTADLANLMARIAERNAVAALEATNTADVNEMIHDVHRLQWRIMSMAAARAYPTQYRLYGRSHIDPDPRHEP